MTDPTSAVVRWTPLLDMTERFTGALSHVRAQQWAMMRECALDLVTADQLPLYECLRVRAHLYRAYKDLALGYVSIVQAEQMETTMGRVIETMRERGALPEGFTYELR